MLNEIISLDLDIVNLDGLRAGWKGGCAMNLQNIPKKENILNIKNSDNRSFHLFC